MKKLLLFLLPALLVFSSCNIFNSYGKKVQLGESEIFYKGDGVTEDNAQKVGEFLVKNKIISKKKKSSVQVTKDDGAYVVHIILDPEKTDESVKLNMWVLQTALSDEVFDGKQARFAFSDNTFKDLEVLNPVKRLKVGAGSLYYDNGEFKKNEVQKLADFLKEKQYMGDEKNVDVFLTKEDDAPVVRLVVDKDKVEQSKETVMPEFSYWQSQIQDNVLAKNTKIVLTDVQYEDFKKVPKITPEQKQQYENQTTDQTTTNNAQTMDSLTTQTSSGILRLNND